MADHSLAAATALWLGILTSVSPCPLATNIAAISFIGRRVEQPGQVVAGGALYTLGRSVTYVVLGSALVFSLISAPYVSNFLQTYMNKVLGPVLVLVGMFLLGLLQFHWGGWGMAARMENRARKAGLWGALLLGIGFALSFCPVSAALFFGSLVPLAVQNESAILLPTIYGVGTAVPVVAFAIVVSLGAHSLGRLFDNVTRVERWARRITGVVFVGVGIYLSLVYIFEVG
ncbi:MAG: aromatic aminobenezylarsenical efflux permease ArsG family transporter [Candidatus Latescibacterota bacterium]|jgi:cytochrome c biogenesis protein CcdA